VSERASTRLSDREEQILALVARLRFLTAAQLADFLFGGSTMTARSRTVLTQRALAALKRAGLIASQPRIVGGPEFGEGRPT